ncbi:MAG: hypothetical protein AB7O62_24100 [Pirellulales bacterium]
MIDTRFIDALPGSQKGRVVLTIEAGQTKDLGAIKLAPKLFEHD